MRRHLAPFGWLLTACSGLTTAQALPLGQRVSVALATTPVDDADVVPAAALVGAAQAATEPQALHAGQGIVVSGRLDAARDEIAPGLGAVQYTLGPAQIAATPQGQNANFNQVLLRAPGVVLDSFGEEHVRGEHGGLTYRVNGVLLPESLNGFGQELDTRIAKSVSLITGSLPAQFGFRTAGIVDVTTKTSNALAGNQIGIYGGSYDWMQPSFQLGGTSGADEYYASGSFLHNGIGIENPTPSRTPIHDDTNQGKLFVYAAHTLDDDSRVSLLTSGTIAHFQLPDTPGLEPAFTLAGAGPVSSRDVDENQTEKNGYLVLSFQRSAGALNLQVSPFVRIGEISFRADRTHDLIFQGVAGDVDNGFTTAGLQADASLAAGSAHTVRAGLLAQHTSEYLHTLTFAFPVDAEGNQSSTIPLSIPDRTGNRSWEAGVYLQDEWKLTGRLTLNYGARYDRFDANFDHEGQLSLRANLVWTPGAGTTLHAGYSRYFAPPSTQFIPPRLFATGSGDDRRARDARRHADEGRAIELFRFGRATGDPARLAGDDRRLLQGRQKPGRSRPVRRGGYPVAVQLQKRSRLRRRAIDHLRASRVQRLRQLQLRRDERHRHQFRRISVRRRRAGLYRHYSIQLDHEGRYTVSAGASYDFHAGKVYGGLQYGYGLRSGFANTAKQPSYATFNIGGEHSFTTGVPGKKLTLRVDIVNLFDHVYQLRDGSGLGISAAQYGQRRGFFFGISDMF